MSSLDTYSTSAAREVSSPHTNSGNSRPARSRQSVAKKWFFRAVSLLLAVCGAGMVGELALRMAVEQEGKRWATYDRTLGWRGRPHASGWYLRKSDDIRAQFRYNELGFRDQPVPSLARDGRRLMLLGDSFVESLEVDLADTFAAVLERSLQRHDNNWDVCVVGSQGYSTAQELLAFRQYQPHLQANIVLLCFYCGNDFSDNLRQRFAYLDEQQHLVLPQHDEAEWVHQGRAWQRWLYESSHVVYLVKNSAEALVDLPLVPAAKETVDQGWEYQTAITRQLLQQLHRDVTAHASRLGVVIIPDRDDLRVAQPQKADWVAATCQSLQIPCLDLTPHLSNDDYFQFDLHFNLRGHRTAAQAIERFLVDEFELNEADLLESAVQRS